MAAGVGPSGGIFNAAIYLSHGEVLGGAGGTDFDDGIIVGFSPIVKFVVRAGYYVDAVQTVIDEGGTPLEIERRGGSGGAVFEFVLQPGETVVKVEGFHSGEYIHGLRFTSTAKVSDWFGRSEGDHQFTITAPLGHEVAGFWGRCGLFLDAIGGVFRPVLPQGYTAPQAAAAGVIIPVSRQYESRPVVPAQEKRTWNMQLMVQDSLFVLMLALILAYGFRTRLEQWWESMVPKRQ
mmetsp:Transcript_37096/g.60083  ORF Transcript_37096/g.60083 Transcript_37096/m.60083 type:complete len:235 (-) Transcript_37096:43-747(-)|eukprot:CAMPEP_0184657722 /NCGR_PEP_ID=MMETSP0308-20130426/21494_1 /TAXON_ID=38269 /ORGANISM="Gloeochaete witrockiana, Strain SAG 46.84" /LENGTH=234 /DNA_ID=CAMNT_0027095915 /DNA_START=22 /DNA_END=726 /DNA_ORIENTATION=-